MNAPQAAYYDPSEVKLLGIGESLGPLTCLSTLWTLSEHDGSLGFELWDEMSKGLQVSMVECCLWSWDLRSVVQDLTTLDESWQRKTDLPIH